MTEPGLDLVTENRMNQTEQDFQRLMEQIRAGSKDAVCELIDEYGPHIMRVVRRRMHQRLRTRYDSADFVQAVWTSFFGLSGQVRNFKEPQDLVRFLARLASNKVIDAYRRRVRAAQSGDERSLDGSAAAIAARVAGGRPSPSQFAVAQESRAQLLDQIPPHQRCILELLWQGHTCKEAAQALGMDEKTIRRVVRSLATGSPADDEPGEGIGQPAFPSAAEVKPAIPRAS